MADPIVDPNIEALDPYIRDLRKSQARETLATAGRVLTGQPAPARPDYTDQRIKLISLLDNLRKMETDLRAEQAKTGRVSIAAEATLLKALADLGQANIAGINDVQAARIGAYADRVADIEKMIEREGTRRPDQLKENAATQLNALGAYVQGGKVKPGQETAFTVGLINGLQNIRTTSPVDTGLLAVFADEIKNRYGLNVNDFVTAPGTAANVVPALITQAGGLLREGYQAQLANTLREEELKAEKEKFYDETIGGMAVQPGSFLATQLNAYERIRGVKTEPGAAPPPITAPREQKEAYLQTVNPALQLSSDGKEVTISMGAEGPTRTFSYATVAQMGTPGVQRLAGVSMTDFLDQQEKYVLRELDRLENATDLDSVRLRKMIMASPELAAWAEQNGYAEFRPEQQFKALLVARRGEVADQNKAFRAKLDADIMGGEGGPLKKAGAAVRDFFRPPEEKVRRPREDSADLTGGATTPAGKTEATGATETEPKGPGPETEAEKKEAAETEMTKEAATALGQVDFDAEAAAKTRKMGDEALAPKAPLLPDTQTDVALSRGRNEATVQRALRSVPITGARAIAAGLVGAGTFKPEMKAIADQYQAIQSFKTSDPAAYATALAGIANEVRRLERPKQGTIEAGTGTLEGEEVTDSMVGDLGLRGREMPAEARAKAAKEYRESLAKQGKTEELAGLPAAPTPIPAPATKRRIIPPGRRGTITGPDMTAPTEEPAALMDFGEETFEGTIEPAVGETPVMPTEDTAVSPDAVMEAALRSDATMAEAPVEEAAPASLGLRMPTPTAGTAPAQRQPSLPMFESFGAEAATEAATNAMMAAQTAEEQMRARRKALLLGTPMSA